MTLLNPTPPCTRPIPSASEQLAHARSEIISGRFSSALTALSEISFGEGTSLYLNRHVALAEVLHFTGRVAEAVKVSIPRQSRGL